MENTNKKISLKYIFLIIVGLLFIIIIFFLFRLHKTPKTSETIQSTTTIASPTSIAMAISNKLTDGIQYKANKYVITYPNTWQPSVLQFQGGNAAIIKPQNLPGKPMIVVEAYDATQNVAKKQALYLAEGCKKEIITNNSHQYEKLNCVFNVRTIDGIVFREITQQQMIYMPTPKALYVVKYYYSSPERIFEYDTLLTQMLSSLQITE